MRLQTILLLLLILAMAGIIFVAALGLSSALPAQDLAQYWAAAHLARQNPYSLQQVVDFEKAAGCKATRLVMRNPPWTIPVILPLALLNYSTAYAFWVLLTVVAVAGCARAIWKLLTPTQSLAPAFLSLIFGPTICLVMLGQLAVLELLGISLFLVFVERRRDWLAGASLLLVLIKPHVALPFLVAVLLWTLHRKRWGVLWAGAIALIGSSLAAVAINPRVFAQFLQFAGQYAQETLAYPNLGGILYLVTGRHALALLPQMLGLCWLAWYWRRHRASWDWKTHGMLVLLVSIVSSYFSYSYDEIIVLPALIAAYATGNRRIFLAGFIFTNLGWAAYIGNFAGRFGYDYTFLCWTPCAWLLTYLLSRRQTAPLLVPEPVGVAGRIDSQP